TDPETDIAVIQVPAEHLNALKLFDTSKLRVGDYVVAIGNPFGLGQTVTSGIVSALGRSGLGIEGIEDFIQTDASINPGNSGGALVNLRGELIGINTAILSPGGGGNVGIGFAIPVNMVREIMDQLVQYGEVKRGRLGVAVQDLTPDLANAFNIELREGAVIAQVVDGSPAAIAGLKAGDVVTKINDRHVTNSSDLRNAIGLLRVGQKVNLTITRNRSEKTLVATITAPKIEKVDAGKLSPKLAGATLGLSELETVENGLVKAVTIVELGANSPAARAGLRKGDIILSVNRQVVKNFDEFKSALKNNSRGLLLNIQRGENAMFLLLQ
ncbi:MAG: PDZ domain-containing protein, partial [Gammaproteobacteria bacterium]|nr:PDZ domain-containing protein [Gammaproteobacteria bacterium]